MAQGQNIRVTSIDVMQEFRPALIRFVEEATAAVSSADADAGRTLEWVQREQLPYWKKELRRREEELTRAKSELIRKQAGGGKGDERQAVEEKKAVEKAKRRVDEADAKIKACQRWGRELERAMQMFKGQVQSLNSMLNAELPNAIAMLDRMTAALEQYSQAPRHRTGDAPGSVPAGEGGAGGG